MWRMLFLVVLLCQSVMAQNYILPEENVPEFYETTFYPPVETLTLSGGIVLNSNPIFFADRNVIRIRPMGNASSLVNDTSAQLPDTWINAARSPFCSSHLYLGSTSTTRFDDHDVDTNDIEVVCRPFDPTIAAIVQLNPPALSPNEPGLECSIPPCVPAQLQHILTNASIPFSLPNIIAATPTFSYTRCKQLPSGWFADPSCDTRSTCFDEGLGGSGRGSLLNPECFACDWDCDYAKQCYVVTGLPHISFFQSEANDFLPCLDSNDCTFECCETQDRSNIFEVTHSVECVFKPNPSPPNAAACSTGERFLARCSAQATYAVDAGVAKDPTTAIIEPYRCDYTCLYPCTNPQALQLLACDQNNILDDCDPVIVDQGLGGPHDRLCRVSILDNPLNLCPNGETPVSFKDPVEAIALGEDPYEPVEESFVPVPPGLLKQCSETDTQACATPLCLCVQPEGCANHPTCNGVGTLHQSLNLIQEDVCVCNDGYAGSRCESKVYDSSCAMGQNLQS